MSNILFFTLQIFSKGKNMDNKHPHNTPEQSIITMENTEIKAHPQRKFMKKICDILFYLGAGNFWYEDRNLGRFQQILYNIYAVTFNFYLFGNYLNQALANIRELTPKENSDSIQFTIAHFHLCAKFVMLYMARNRVKIFLKRILEEDREFAILEIDLRSIKMAKLYCLSLVLTLFNCLSAATIDAIVVHINKGKLDFVMKMVTG